jgi:tRNA A-37 threonylcarbamoyl transferase component Bud32
MSTISDPKRCPKCGGPIPAEAPQGLCPKCLLQQVCIPTEAGENASAKSAPPTREELAAAFPQLEILELIGQGGMGFVFKARQSKIERLVALKILPQSLAADPAFAERFTREARMLARLNHPNIVTLHDFGQARGFFYLLMEFVDGVNLRQAMKVGRFTPAQAMSVVPKICEALQFAHNEGILHRDIKPENILLDSKGRVKIADFGIAKLVESADRAPGQPGTAEPAPAANLTETGKVLGTPQYMSPEQREHPQDVDQRADIYSLGVVFYEMLTGELPLGHFAPPSEKSAVDPRVDEVVRRTLEKEREHRTRSAAEVKTQVETITATPTTDSSRLTSQAESRVATAATTTLRRPRSLIQVAALFIVAGCFAAWDIGSHKWPNYYLNFGVLGLPIGIGLLRLRPRWRAVALLLPWVVFGIVAIVGVIALYGGTPTRVTGPSHIGYAIVGMFVSVMLFVWMNGVLIRADVSALFKPGTRGHPWVEWAAMVGAIAVSFVLSLWTAPSEDVEVNLATQPPAVSAASSFGPVVERELAFRAAIDFDTSKVALLDGVKREGIPGEYFPFGPKREQGLDAWCVDLTQLAPAEMRLKRLANERWDKTTPEQLVQEVHSISAYDPPLSSMSVPTNGPTSYGFQTREGAVGLLQVLGYAEGTRGVKVRYKLVRGAAAPATAPAELPDHLPPAGGSSATVPSLAPSAPEGKLVLNTVQFTRAHPEPGELVWGFKCFVPPGQLASILFVRWTNGVPQVDPGFSGYFKVGKAGGIDIPFCSLSCYPIPESQFAGLNEAERRQVLAPFKYPESSSVSNAVQWNVNLGLGFTGSRWVPMPPYHGVELHLPQSLHSGHQRVIRLLDFDTPEGNATQGLSGVELRIFLEPLKSPPIRMVPTEVDHTNYISGTGLAGTMEEALRAIKEWPTDP